MDDGAAAGTPTDNVDGYSIVLASGLVGRAMGLCGFGIGRAVGICQRWQAREDGAQVAFDPRVLVAADDDAGAVAVEEEDVRSGRGVGEEVVLEGEVVVWVGAR